MKVLLEKDIVGIGRKGDIRDVKDGYFRNFLFPNKLAIIATREKIKAREREMLLKEKAKDISEENISRELQKLSGQTFRFEEKTNEKGSLYKAITARDILEKLNADGFSGIRADWIIIEKPIKRAGKSQIEIRTPSGQSAQVLIEVVGQR